MAKYFAYVLSGALNPIDFYMQRLNHLGVLQGDVKSRGLPIS